MNARALEGRGGSIAVIIVQFREAKVRELSMELHKHRERQKLLETAGPRFFTVPN